MEYWNELRTALAVAQAGTVSTAAVRLGLHRATVNRHIDQLEAVFNTRLFQRHQRGYHLTEAGSLLLKTVGRADEMFSDLTSQLQNRNGELSGRLNVTTLSGIVPLIMPAILSFQRQHPKISVNLKTSAALARLEIGEAHVAIRAGVPTEHPDYIVQPFTKIRFGLYARHEYLETFGVPDNTNYQLHRFVSVKDEGHQLPFTKWFDENVPLEAISIEVDNLNSAAEAIKAGVGIGFLDEEAAGSSLDIEPIIPLSDTFSVAIWLLTHVDLHQTEKVQSFTKHLKSTMAHRRTQSV